MTEQDRESLKNFLAEEAEKARLAKQAQEQVRQELEKRARQAIEQYKQECKELRPLAEKKVQNIVQPWFKGLVQDGTYDQLLEWLRIHDGRGLSVSDSILYYWPDKAFRGFRYSEEMGQKPFQGDANYIVKNNTDYQAGIERLQSGVDEVWSAGFHIGRRTGLYISQWPIIGGGYGLAVGRARDLEIPVDVENIRVTIPSIHPDVWIGFANQVENRTPLRVLQESLIPKPIRTIDVDSPEHAEKNRADFARREEYLRAKRG